MKSALGLGVLVLSATAACAPMRTPENIEAVEEGASYQAHYRSADADILDERNKRSMAMNAERCQISSGQPLTLPVTLDVALESERLSRGDLLEVLVQKDEVFSGEYEVSRDGKLKLPFADPVPAANRSVGELEREIAERLVREGYYRRRPEVSVRVMDFASAKVYVGGAVFDPGSFEVGRVSGDDRDDLRQTARGASTEGRNLSLALQAAGGVRPDADLSAAVLRRDGVEYRLDLRPAIEGRAFADVMLLSGDEIELPSRGCFQEALMAPSAITAPGVRIFVSNLTKPADANALSANGKEARELRYGSRFLQAVVGMNCVGGAAITNADRYAVLFTRNPVTDQSIVVERRIEDLLRRPDRDDLDPYILPGDSIACYDSAFTNVAEVAKIIGVVGVSGLLFGL
ncbi:MAG: polysaccharide biosynthesis/export family protein [Kiloniellales bacterium]